MRKHRNYSLPPTQEAFVSAEFQNLDTNKQDKQHKFFTRAPIAAEVGEREIVVAFVSGSAKVYTKIYGVLYVAALAAA